MVKLTRAQLFVWLWTNPAEAIAADAGISGTYLRKICVRFDIPKPPRGYWRRLQTGKPGRQPRLPNPEENKEVPLSVTEERATMLGRLLAGDGTKIIPRATTRAVNHKLIDHARGDGRHVEAKGTGAQEGRTRARSVPARLPIAPDSNSLLRLGEQYMRYGAARTVLDDLYQVARKCDPHTRAAALSWITSAQEALADVDPVFSVLDMLKSVTLDEAAERARL